MKEKWRDILKKYRFAALVALVGVVLMLLPGKKDSMPDAETAERETFSLEETERRMAEVLGAMDGVGRVQVMLTLRSGETLSLAEDSSATLGSGGDVRQDSQVLTVNRGSGKQEVVVTQRAVSHLSGRGGGLPGGGRQPGAAAGDGDGGGADGTQQR